MRVTCQCGSKLVISKQIKISPDLSHFYGDCSNCGDRWRGSTTLDHVVDESENTKLKAKLLNLWNNLGYKEKEKLVAELDPS